MTNVKMDFSEEQQDRFIKFLNENWPEPQRCPICQHEEFDIQDFFSESREANPSNLKNIKFAPLIAVTCIKCGYTFFFNAIVSDIYKKQEVPNEIKSASTKDVPSTSLNLLCLRS